MIKGGYKMSLPSNFVACWIDEDGKDKWDCMNVNEVNALLANDDIDQGEILIVERDVCMDVQTFVKEKYTC